MHEQLIREFAERAEAGVRLPDVAVLQERGHQRRRHHHVAAAIAAACAVAATGLGFLVSTGGGDNSAPPSDDSSHRVDLLNPDRQIASGGTFTHEVFGQAYSDTVPDGQLILATFQVAGQDWYWLRDSIGKLAPGGDLDAWPAGPYAEVRMSMVDRVPVVQCRQDTITWKDGDGDPVGFARQVAALPVVEVLSTPRATSWSGYPAAHLRVRVPHVCEGLGDAVLWSVFPSSSRQLAGVGTVFRAGQTVDLTFVNVEGSLVVVSTTWSPGVPKALRAETAAIADSIRLEVVDQ